jgi:hypothetical protein
MNNLRELTPREQLLKRIDLLEYEIEHLRDEALFMEAEVCELYKELETNE